jgi:predicted metal-dependent peptidase
MMNNSSRDKIRRAFDSIYDNHPYLASIVASWKVQEMSDEWFAMRGLPATAATTGPDLFYSATFIEQLSIREVCDLILHEAAHVFLGHHFRFEGKKPRTWNVAADLALNDYVKEYYDQSGLIYKEGLFPGYHRGPYAMKTPEQKKNYERFSSLEEGKSAEYYFDAVCAMREAEKQARKEKEAKEAQKQETKKQKSEFRQRTNAPAMGDPDDGDDADDGGEGAAQDPTEDMPTKTAGSGKATRKNSEPSSEEKSQPKAETAQSGEDKGPAEKKEDPAEADDSATEGEDPHDADDSLTDEADDESDLPQAPGELLPHPAMEDMDEDEIAEAKQEWEQQVAEGINNAKQQGNLPGWVREMVKEYDHESPVNPEMLLRQFMTQYAPTSTSYSRPNRRSAYRKDLLIPAQRAKDLSPGYILVDTSGSMSEPECNTALALIEKTCRLFPHVKLTMGQADTRLIADAEKTFTLSDFPLRIPHEWAGRGGTNLAPAIKEVGESRKYEWLIVISDMEWHVDRAVDPRIPTLWLTTQEIRDAYQKPKFGQVVPITVKRKY